jgi:hypothetical protein
MPDQEPKLAAITVVGDQKPHGTSCRPGAGAELDQLEKILLKIGGAIAAGPAVGWQRRQQETERQKIEGNFANLRREQSGRGSGPSPFTSPIIFIS